MTVAASASGAPTPDLAGITLAIDCSTAYLAMALVDHAGMTLATSASDVGRQHAALLTVHLAELFATAGVDRRVIGRVNVGIGPGSYTGVRVAVAAARGLSRALGSETVGVDSLLAHAGSGLAIGERVVVTHDARRGNLYAQPCTRLPREPSAGSQEPTALIVSLAAPTKVAADALA